MAALFAIFRALRPFDAGEIAAWNAVQAGGSFKAWFELCFEHRGGSAALGVLPIEGPDSRMRELLRTQPWRLGETTTTGEMTKAYAHALNGLDQLVRASSLPGGGDIWMTATVSLGPVPWHAYEPDEPMIHAFRQAARAGITLSVAAGNEAQILPGNTLNPWCLAPWVIGVAATTADGRRLLDCSSRGLAEQPDQTPTVAAPGENVATIDGLDHEDDVAIENIRNAAPGTVNIASTTKHTYLLRKDAEGVVWMSMMKQGVPGPEAPLEQVLELFREEKDRTPGVTSGTSFAAEYVSALCGRVAKDVKRRLPNLPPGERPKVLKALLEEMAQPMADYARWEAGKGLVTHAIADEFLAGLGGDRLDAIHRAARDRW